MVLRKADRSLALFHSSPRSYSKHSQRAGEMAQRVKVLTAEPEDLSLIPGTHLVERTDSHNLHTCHKQHKKKKIRKHSEVRYSGLHLKAQHLDS